MQCRFCKSELKNSLVSLGASPLSNRFLKATELNRMEPYYPLEVYVCSECFLVQLDEFESPQNIFTDYSYFSSYSASWLKHCEKYVDSMVDFLKLDANSKVIEIASNDGYLLQYFIKANIPSLGIEPARNVAEVAKEKGIPTETAFFGIKTANNLISKGIQADLLLGNNVLAHVPDINDFVRGMKIVLKPQGVITMEFPHLMKLIEQVQFDTIYHEHFSYFSFLSVERIFRQHGLVIFDVEELSTHGGSLRIYARHEEDTSRIETKKVGKLRDLEELKGYGDLAHYLKFAPKVREIKREILKFLILAKEEGKTIVGYGAPAKGNTLLNYCGIRTDFLEYTVDRSPYKQGNFLPGTRIPIESPEKIYLTRPDYVLILPWNIKEEIMEQLSFIREWNGKFIIPIPHLEVV
ncbi:MAG TPA: SAM-dependent methyltransferase [Sporomusaceae bacterium]|nr:SAM-dependent methyltransferase [Sporomusaceae bacterium]